MSKARGKVQQEKIRKLRLELNQNLNFLTGSVVKYHMKCGRACQCNKGKGHICFYLSIRRQGRTRILYLPKDSLPKACLMVRRYKKVKKILRKISRINYESLKAPYLKRRKRGKALNWRWF